MRQPDISLAKEKLQGWEPKYTVKERLITTIAYFDDLLKKSK
jgi:UDP-glucuronate decarboxylase